MAEHNEETTTWLIDHAPPEAQLRSARCVNCGGYEDQSIDPEGCTCLGDYRAPWQVQRDHG